MQLYHTKRVAVNEYLVIFFSAKANMHILTLYLSIGISILLDRGNGILFFHFTSKKQRMHFRFSNLSTGNIFLYNTRFHSLCSDTLYHRTI